MEEEMKSCPKVLIISHNVLSKNTSMGKTMDTYFKGWDRKKIAQLYFHSEIPTSDICLSYFKFTDIDAVKSIFNRKHVGKVLSEDDVHPELNTPIDTGKLTNIYNFGRRRSPLIYLLRDTIWKCSSWNSKKLKQWIAGFNPDIVFFASGDYAFPYHIALNISNEFSIPLVTCCFDDYYIFNKNETTLFGKLQHKLFMNVVKQTISRSSYIFTVNDLMSEAYSQMFQKICPVLYTGSDLIPSTDYSRKNNNISYLGGLGLCRDKQLIDIGKTLLQINDPRIPKYIDVYSGETDTNLIKNMTKENGIIFHGSVSASEVEKIVRNSKALVHTESFKYDIKQRVMYSLSTKIPDSISSGTCLLAYGPVDIASIDYLVKNKAAFVAGSKEELKTQILSMFLNDDLRLRVISNALKLSQKNHNSKAIPMFVYSTLTTAIQTWRER